MSEIRFTPPDPEAHQAAVNKIVELVEVFKRTAEIKHRFDLIASEVPADIAAVINEVTNQMIKRAIDMAYNVGEEIQPFSPGNQADNN